jgi:hypothetical protein
MVVRFYHWDPSMTLATVILLINFPWMTPPAGLTHQAAASATPATQTQDQGTPPAEAPSKDRKPPSPPTTAPKRSATEPQPAKKPVHRKPAAASNCDAGAQATSGSNPSPAPATTAAKTSPPASGNPPKNCPPSKIIVRQGGASDPSIQLAGGPSGGRSQQQDATTQFLGITEDNLKKLNGQQLNTHQQDSVTQIREWVEQSKTALASGDAERAHTLAWKAKVLSEDLVKPAK